MKLDPVRRQSASDAVFEQLAGHLLSGEVAPGHPLPAERSLTETLGVNRQAVREALKRLAQAGLVKIHQGEPTKALDFRRSAGMGILPRLLFRADGSPDAQVIRSIMEMRAGIGPDAARLAAMRAGSRDRARLVQLASEMSSVDDLESLATSDLMFWELIIDSSDNIAYRLAFNGLRDTYAPMSSALAPLFASELKAAEIRTALADQIAADDAGAAHATAAQLLSLGTAAINGAFDELEAVERSRATP